MTCCVATGQKPTFGATLSHGVVNAESRESSTGETLPVGQAESVYVLS